MGIKKSPELGDGPLAQRPIPRTQEQLDVTKREIIFWEDRNPKSVINLVSERLQELMRQLPQSLLAMSEKEIRRKLEPGWTEEQLRIAFWDEYFITIDNNAKKMRVEAVFARVCTKEHFYDKIKNPLTLAYMCKPPQDYIYQMRSLLNIGLERFAEILNLPLEVNGRVDTRLITEIVKIVSIVDNRVKGAVTQKIQIDGTQKNLNMNVNYEAPKTHQDIQKELQNIEKEIKQLQSPQPETLFFPDEEVEGVDDSRSTELIDVSATTTQA